MLEQASELYGLVNVLSQDGKTMLFDKTINKDNIFYNWSFGELLIIELRGQLWEEKTLLVLKYFCCGLFY